MFVRVRRGFGGGRRRHGRSGGWEVCRRQREPRGNGPVSRMGALCVRLEEAVVSARALLAAKGFELFAGQCLVPCV
jgi:hypothetical protein